MERTRTARVTLADGVVVATVFPDVVQSPEDARVNLGACTRVALGVPRGLVVDIRRCRPLDAPTRHVYSGEALNGSFLRLALVVDATPLGRMMGNLYLRVASPGLPARLFGEPDAAFAWAGAGS